MTFFHHSLEISRYSPLFSTLTQSFKNNCKLHFTTANSHFTTAYIVINYTLNHMYVLCGGCLAE